MLHRTPRTRPPRRPSRYWSVTCGKSCKQAAHSSAVRSGVHCTAQYIVGSELMSIRAVVNLLELLTADSDVSFSRVNRRSLMESALSVKFWVIMRMISLSLAVAVDRKSLLEKLRMQES